MRTKTETTRFLGKWRSLFQNRCGRSSSDEKARDSGYEIGVYMETLTHTSSQVITAAALQTATPKL